MPQLPLAFKLLVYLGWSITGWAIFLDTPIGQQVFDSMPMGFKYSIWLFACCFLLINCLRAYEKYRADKIKNDDAEMILRDKQEQYDIAHPHKKGLGIFIPFTRKK